MTRDEIVEIAWDVGLFMRSHKFQDEPTRLERFAERIAAHEREECAKVCEEKKRKYHERLSKPEEARDIDPEVARIAKMTCDLNAAAIRARGDT